MAWTGKRTGAAVAAAAALAGGVYATGSSPAGAAPAGSAAPAAAATTEPGSSWHTALALAGSVAAPSGEVAPAITGARTLRFSSTPTRGRFVDVGPRGESPGDVFVFEERLTQGGERFGRDATACTLLFTTVRCESTFTVAGQGSFEISQALGRRPVLAVTGGTGDFRNVRGQARIVGGSEDATHWEVTLLP